MISDGYPDNGDLPPNASSVDYTYWQLGDGLLENGNCSGLNAVYRDGDGKMVSQALTKPAATVFISQITYRGLYDQNHAYVMGTP